MYLLLKEKSPNYWDKHHSNKYQCPVLGGWTCLVKLQADLLLPERKFIQSFQKKIQGKLYNSNNNNNPSTVLTPLLTLSTCYLIALGSQLLVKPGSHPFCLLTC